MSDIASIWDNENATSDFMFGSGDLNTAPAIESAVRVSLFTERGWIGSRLHELDRAKKSSAGGLLLQARDYAREALQWLVDDGAAATIDVRTQYLDRTAIHIEVTVTQPGSSPLQPFRYSYAWS